MTEPKARHARVHLIGALALIVLLIEWITLYRMVGPLTGSFLPQMHFGAFTSGDLFTFAAELSENQDRFDLYERLLQWVDPVFILLFCLWLFKAMRPRMLALAALLTYGLFDLAENTLLLYYLGDLRMVLNVAQASDAPALDAALQDPTVLFLSYITSAKLAFGALCAAYTVGCVIANRRRTQAAP
ncbi:hypothetical protein ACN2XU_02145 [Primorskyibacter sp. 2E107]|uniref:hypothetical protein n=1 Tax=Primorskyibacter sp. 2E107 TaxID=3403458 RepID=UPI003AF7345A